MIAAAGNRCPVAAEESPVLRTPIVKPEPILGGDRLPKFLQRSIGPRAGRGWFYRSLEPELADKFRGHQGVATTTDLQSVVFSHFGEVRKINCRIAEFANGTTIFDEQRIVFCQIWQQP